jgi:hypothetical protein
MPRTAPYCCRRCWDSNAVSLKSDAEEGHIELTVGDEIYIRTADLPIDISVEIEVIAALGVGS